MLLFLHSLDRQFILTFTRLLIHSFYLTQTISFFLSQRRREAESLLRDRHEQELAKQLAEEKETQARVRGVQMRGHNQ